MKIIKIILVLVFVFKQTAHSQSFKINGVEIKSSQGTVKDVHFKMSNSRLYSYNKVDIILNYMPKKDTVLANVKCFHNFPNKSYTTDTIIGVSKKQFSKVCTNLFEIQSDSIKRHFFMLGHGRLVSIKYGDSRVFVSYGLSNPSKEKEYNFYEACRLTLELVGIRPSWFLSSSKSKKTK
ncbi:hypothetical protein [Ochrovirga pacifica]|uniref:hypothetical protein n=1 Tax=Ochrovirga pacifica TaxID=1042376 RepID=UPI0002557F64|nr:hypothetical protein [Ochrovirga pacifica]